MEKSKEKSSSTVSSVHDTVSEKHQALLWGFSADISFRGSWEGSLVENGFIDSWDSWDLKHFYLLWKESMRHHTLKKQTQKTTEMQIYPTDWGTEM